MAATTQSRCLDTAHANGFTTPESTVPNVPQLNLPEVALAMAPESEWTLRLAKQKYKDGELSRREYEGVRKALKDSYREKVHQLKVQYKSGAISKKDYKQELLNAKYDYAG